MILNFCSWYGDIEIVATDTGCTIEWWKLAPREKKALSTIFQNHHVKVTLKKGGEGEASLPIPVVEAGALLSSLLHAGRAPLTAVRFSTGSIRVVEGGPDRAPEGERAVTVPKPLRGCPMPTVLKLKEERATRVLEMFLTPGQHDDFRRHRQFVAMGNDTGRLYVVTSRWSPLAAKRGVLYDTAYQHTICASNLSVPPAEECLGIKLAVEHFERRFLAADHENW